MDIEGRFLYGGINASGVPDFVAGGSEQKDGSTLIQNPATHKYTLTRADGSKAVFDSRGRLLQMLDNRSRAITYGYTNNRVTSISDAAGQTITLVYDQKNRIAQAKGLGTEIVNYIYDPAGDLIIAERLRQGERIAYSYEADSDHRLTKVTLPDKVVETTTVSDLLDRAKSTGDARGNTFTRTFEASSRPTVTIDPSHPTGTIQQTDSLGRPVLFIDDLGRAFRLLYTGNQPQPSTIILFAHSFDATKRETVTTETRSTKPEPSSRPIAWAGPCWPSTSWARPPSTSTPTRTASPQLSSPRTPTGPFSFSNTTPTATRPWPRMRHAAATKTATALMTIHASTNMTPTTT